MGVWVVLMNANEFINAVVWRNDSINRAPIWCDISVKIGLGGQVGRLAAVFCIARFLADVVSPRATAITRQDRRRRAFYDYFVSFGVPVLIVACHIIYQANRFIIQRGVGCTVSQVMSWPTLVLRMIWGPVISYLLIGVPLTIYSAFSSIMTSGRYYDYSWTYFRGTWRTQPVLLVDTPGTADLPRWSNIIVGVIFFAAFGFGTEATCIYKKVVRSCIGPKHTSQTNVSSFFGAVLNWRTRLHRPSAEAASTGEEAHAIRIFTQDTRMRPSPLSAGVKVVVEKEEDIV
ncbi:hypothetical protein JCM11641_003512 [Rhodosporidiobolus odoratus]